MRVRVALTLLAAGALGFGAGHAVRSYRVEGRSMAPALQPGERILISPAGFRWFGVDRGDLVVFDHRETAMVKRVVALPGDTVRFAARRGRAPAPLVLDGDRYFVLGDNRGRSRDSRQFGAVAGEAIVGKVLFRYWPLERMGRL